MVGILKDAVTTKKAHIAARDAGQLLSRIHSAALLPRLGVGVEFDLCDVAPSAGAVAAAGQHVREAEFVNGGQVHCRQRVTRGGDLRRV